MQGKSFGSLVLSAALSLHCGGNSTGDAHQIDHAEPSPDAGEGRAGSSAAGGGHGSGNGGASSNFTGGATGESGAGGVGVAGAGGGAAMAAGGATASETPDGSVTPTCQNQKPEDGASCTALNLSCGGGCRVCTCTALPGGGARWKCVALVC